MDSVSHTHVARLLLPYIEQQTGITIDQSAFFYGNLKPDLTGTYLTVRHYPSLMMENVIGKIHTFCQTYTIDQAQDNRDFVVDLGEICHYITDFFTYPHNDDIYTKNLLQHYIYEKRMTLLLSRRLTEQIYLAQVEPMRPALQVEALEAQLRTVHAEYKMVAGTIDTDLMYISKMITTVALSILGILQLQKVEAENLATAKLA